jgi:hypothetical protein
MKKLLVLSLVLLLLTMTACSNQGIAAPESPTPVVVLPVDADAPVDGDTPVSSDDPVAPSPPSDLVVTGPVDAAEIEADLLLMESYPVQYLLTLRGTSPTPCHQVSTTRNEPNAQNEIHIEAVFAADPDEMCIQVLGEFSTSINLGSFPAGETFTVWMNGVQVAEFTA